MLKLTVSVEQLRICEYLERLGWVRNMVGDYHLIGDLVGWNLEFRGSWWHLNKFTVSNLGGADIGRYVPVQEGQTLEELYFALAESGALPVEQYFSDEVGDEPRMQVSVKAALVSLLGSVVTALVLFGAIYLVFKYVRA